jgi:trigger factor
MFIHQLEHRLEDQGLDMQTYLKTRQIDADELRNETRSSAEVRLKRSLTLFQVAKDEDIQVDDQEVQAEAMATLNQINQAYSPQEQKKMMTNDFIQNMVGNITSDLLIKNTLTRLEAYAKGELASEETAAAEKPAPKKRSTRASKTKTPVVEETATSEAVEAVVETKPKSKRAKKSE